MQTERDRSSTLVPLIVVLFGMIVAFHLGNALAGKSLFRFSHLGAALEYAHGPINLLRPVIIGFNATDTPTPQELPVWQAATGLVFKLARSTWFGWANLVSLLFFSAGLWPFFQLARQYVGGRAAYWSLAFFLAQPLVVVQAGKASTDGFSLVMTLWFLFFADRMIRRNQWRWWLPMTLFGALSAVTKVPFFMAAGLGSVALLWINQVRTWRPWLMLFAGGAIAAGVFFGWTHYCDSVLAQAVYPYNELRLSHSSYIVWWYFGDLHLRLSPGVWIKGAWRFLHTTLGSLPLMVLALAALWQRGNQLLKYWLLATLLTTLVFFNLVMAHWHYYLMCCPPVAMLCGVTLARWEVFWMNEMPRAWLRTAIAAVALIGSAIDGMVTMKIALDYDYFPAQMSALIRQHTRPDDKLIIYKCDKEWPGEVLYRAGRRGFYVANLESLPQDPADKGLYELLNNPADRQRLTALGYNKLVLISESPVRFAAEAIDPGSHRERIFYPPAISPKIDAWPEVYRSADLLIKEIPQEQPPG